MTKKVMFGTKPTKAVETPNADQWVSHRDTEATKRLTLDIPASLHSRIKATCALRGTKMVDEIRELLEKHFPTDKPRT
jgi:hypothetical protein